MTLDIEFLFDNKLISELENLIKNSKNRLFLVSPFIDLDKRIIDALKEKISLPNFELTVLFGKNENNIYKSVKKDSFDFLMKFPNIEIRYEERLHAKFYLNDTHFIMTSINLYDFSLAKNIECGILANYASKGLIGKVLDEGTNIIDSGLSKLKSDILGLENNEVDPVEKFNSIFNNSKLLYKTEPVYSQTKGISKILNNRKIESYNIKVDKISNLDESSKTKEYQLLSASKLSKKLNISQNKLISLFEEEGLIKDNEILKKGTSMGLVNKNYMGRKYIAFPDNLHILSKQPPLKTEALIFRLAPKGQHAKG